MIWNSIRLKLITPVIAILLLSSVSAYIISENVVKSTIKTEFQSKALVFGEALASNIQEIILNRDPSTIQGIIDEYKSMDGVSFILLVDENHKVLAHTFSPEIPQYYKDLIKTHNGDEYELHPEFREEVVNNERIFLVRIPVLAGLLGDLYIGMGIERKERELIAPLLADMAWTNLISISFASLLVISIISTFTSPLIRLTNEVKRFSSRNKSYEPVPIVADDEIGKLTWAMNQMSERILNYTLNLESEVEKRTKVIQEQQLKLTNSATLSSLGEMAAGIAHEINNPLTIINSSSHLIRKQLKKEDPDFERIERVLQDNDRTVARITKIISGLRNLSRDSSNEEMQASNLSQVFEDVLSLSVDKFRRKGIEFEFDQDHDILTMPFKCRQVQLSQVFINLLNNSADALEELEDKWVKVWFESSPSFITVHVEDSGPGIPDEIAKKIFNPFFTTKGVGKGTGIGLSLSKRIVEDHRGTLELLKNGNTHFVIRLPLS